MRRQLYQQIITQSLELSSGGKCDFFDTYNKLNNLERIRAHKLSHYALSVRLTDFQLLHKRCKVEDCWANIIKPWPKTLIPQTPKAQPQPNPTQFETQIRD